MRLSFALLVISLCSAVHAQHPDTLWQNSLVKFDKKDYHGVIEDMNEFLKLVPNFPDALFNRGIAKVYLGDTFQGCIDLELARESGQEKNNPFINYQCNKNFIRELLIKQFYGKQKVYPELGYRPRYTRTDTLRGALRHERNCYNVFYYDLTVNVQPKKKRIEGKNNIYFKVTLPSSVIQVDLFDDFRIHSILWSNTPLSWKREYNAVFVTFPRELSPGESHAITVIYSGKPPAAPNPPWDGGFVWSEDDNKDLWIGVACEQLGASSWWPVKDHMTDKPDSMQITLQVPKGYKAVSNGNLRNRVSTGKKYDQFTWFVSYPINSYNVTFYIGKYESFGDTLITGRDTVRFDYNVLHYNLDIARKHFHQTRDVVSFYNRAFGMYPFARDGFGLVESPYEGMEHQSAIAYGSAFDNEGANAYRNRLYDFIIVHEAAHEWWGNSVSAGDMADIWIHEGFATYAEYLFLEDRFGKEEYLHELSENSSYIFNVWPLVQNRDVNENTFAGQDVYNKGAIVLHNLRCTMNNDTLFFNLIRDFCINNQYRTVNSEDFTSFVNRYSGSDYTPFFNIFLYSTNLPVLSYSYEKAEGELIITYRWTGVEDGFFMPFGIRINGVESLRVEATTVSQEIRIPEGSYFYFHNLWNGYAGSRDNSFTYFVTNCTNYK